MTTKICSIPGCGGKHRAKGLCAQCYYAKRRASPEHKKAQAEYDASPKRKAYIAKRNASQERKAYMDKYWPKYRASPECRLASVTANSKFRGYHPPDVTVEQLAQDMAVPDKVCGGCREPLGNDFVVEHDHKTGRYRGLWHRGCNLAAGHAGDSSQRLRTIANSLDAIERP